jgi:hypothetical protein
MIIREAVGVPEARRSSASVWMWTGMAVAILGCGLGVSWLIEPGALPEGNPLSEPVSLCPGWSRQSAAVPVGPLA